jgi:hypothetical protein
MIPISPTNFTNREASVEAEQISVLLKRYTSVLWPPNQGLLVEFLDRSDTVAYLVPGDDKVHEIVPGNDPKCKTLTSYIMARVLPDGRLGLIEKCVGRWPDRAPGLDHERYLMAYDWSTGRIEQIVAGPLAHFNLSSEYTWNPDMTRGVQALNGLYATLYWITPAGWEPMNITIGGRWARISLR